jgi:hypothetical protein
LKYFFAEIYFNFSYNMIDLITPFKHENWFSPDNYCNDFPYILQGKGKTCQV